MTADQHDVPADLTAIEAALGRMVYRAGTLETVVRFTGEALASTREDRDELAGTTAGKVLSLTEKIAGGSNDVSSEEYAELTAIFAEIRPCLDSRNVYIHGGWVRMRDQLVALNKKKNVEANAKKGVAADKYRVETRPVAVKELNELSAALLDLSNRVFGWADAILCRKNPELHPADTDKQRHQQINHAIGTNSTPVRACVGSSRGVTKQVDTGSRRFCIPSDRIHAHGQTYAAMADPCLATSA